MSDTQTIMDSLRRVVRALRINSNEIERQCGLSGAQLFALQKVDDPTGLSISEIAARTCTDQSSVSVVVSKLVAKGMLKKQASPEDLRRARHVLTEAGRKIVRQSHSLVQNHLVEAIESLSASEKATISELLKKVVHVSELSSQPASLFFEKDGKG